MCMKKLVNREILKFYYRAVISEIIFFPYIKPKKAVVKFYYRFTTVLLPFCCQNAKTPRNTAKKSGSNFCLNKHKLKFTCNISQTAYNLYRLICALCV